MGCNHWFFSGKDKPCRWRISPFRAELEVAGKKSFLWRHPCFQADHLKVVDKNMKILETIKGVDLLAPLSCHSLSRELSDPADCQSPCHSCHTGTRQHTLISLNQRMADCKEIEPTWSGRDQMCCHWLKLKGAASVWREGKN